MTRSRLPGLLLAALLVAAVLPAAGKVFQSREQAFGAIYGKQADARRESVFLTDKQVAEARKLAGDGVEIREAVLTRYTLWAGEQLLGTAYLDTNRVRTLPQTVLVFVNPDGGLRTVEILSFDEPEEYLPRRRWLDQFGGRRLNRELAIGGRIHGLTGATLTAHAVTDAVRRTLAIHQVLVGSRP